ncbi:hypothetical protein L5515_015705 [Caenorhabditis briggsae]|uniref:Uncharacterized protein n=1 Tax=Caenorhabditis briggsae TaxID=6238 RepID=A0AAE9JAB2_CAEBR|nr:hypothetical protein L5515_015705 [Caenorhabditis briggsae]
MFGPLTILLSLLAVPWINSDPIHVAVNISCPMGIEMQGAPWCATLWVFEEDPISSNDLLKKEEFCNKEHLVNFAYELSPGTDQTPNYEINFQLQHNCSNDHMIRCLKPKQAHDVLTIGHTYLDLQIHAYLDGTLGNCDEKI